MKKNILHKHIIHAILFLILFSILGGAKEEEVVEEFVCSQDTLAGQIKNEHLVGSWSGIKLKSHY